MNGDVLTKAGFMLSYFITISAIILMPLFVCVKMSIACLCVIETEDQLITSVVEKPTYRYKINTGIYVLSPEIVRSVEPDHRIDFAYLA